MLNNASQFYHLRSRTLRYSFGWLGGCFISSIKLFIWNWCSKLFVQISFWKCQEFCVTTSGIDCDFKRTNLISCNIRASKTRGLFVMVLRTATVLGFHFTALISLFVSALWHRCMALCSAFINFQFKRSSAGVDNRFLGIYRQPYSCFMSSAFFNTQKDFILSTYCIYGLRMIFGMSSDYLLKQH